MLMPLRPVNRPTPAGPPQAYQTYQLVFPKETHWVPATCAQIDCDAYLYGWASTFDAHDARVLWIRAESGRRFTETRTPAGQVQFAFPAGQRCFRSHEHKRRLERVPVHRVLHGDFRGAVLLRTHTRGEDWVDEFATHQDRIATLVGRG